MLETDSAVIKGRYLRGANLICQVIDLSLAFYLFNAHGDVVQRVAHDGTRLAEYDYDAFGNQRGEPDADTIATDGLETDPNPFRYCGEYFDSSSGEYYLRASNYDPRTGRFGTEDPARSGLNWYTYCEANPILRIDPSGLDSYIFVDEEMFDWNLDEHVNDTYQAFEDYYGTDVTIVTAKDLQNQNMSFIDWLNSLSGENIDGLALITHGSQTQITDSAGVPYLTINQIDRLSKVNADSVFVFGCNTGLYREEDNFAARLATRVGVGGKVIAPGGVRMYTFTGHTWVRGMPEYVAYYYNSSGDVHRNSIIGANWPIRTQYQIETILVTLEAVNPTYQNIPASGPAFSIEGGNHTISSPANPSAVLSILRKNYIDPKSSDYGRRRGFTL